jgi:hypothetical protein
MIDDDDDITANYHRGNPQSVEAHNSTPRHLRAAQRAEIYTYVFACGDHGCTSDEAEIALDMPHQTCSARFTDLKKDRAIVVTGRTRLTQQGKYAAVCIVVRFQRSHLHASEPNGMATQRESNLQRRIQHAIRTQWPCAFVRKIHGSEYQHGGAHDLHCCIDGLFAGIEVKVPGEEPTELQKHEHFELKRAGGISIIGTSPEQVIAELRKQLVARASST